MKITKKQIVALDKQETTVRELFPEVFETKLEVGKWYKSTKHKKLLVYVTELEKQGSYLFCFGYGIDGHGEWSHLKKGDKVFWMKEDLITATKEEVETALVKAFEKNNKPFEKYKYHFGGMYKGILYGWNGRKPTTELFNNGIWAEIIQPKQMTKEEIKNKL